ncbi:MAG: riboflavin biosynthesis protein RibF [Xanthomarina sp.]|uniref:bifunctional riboflavin kinase/FAD synthetase n=1 Tax=Xanthomarina sp. TaxID=1931211 RepID=UPI000C36B7D9|nr:bifunctional riboflavin kinase/FAD synthetase [Xanthomarina sp.]MAL23846.1 riboflavin biosynthesis protein RibF [Xanthomarina sp.]MBF61921.1 riboflavin biosynthesis protein RibF [Xanthomarina sp.]
MEIYKSLKLDLNFKTVVTIGTFDGVHIGHRKIIERLVQTAKKSQLHSVVLTFFPHPRMVLQKDANIKLINTIEERSRILEQLGLDVLVIKKFTKEFSRLTAEAFVSEILVKQLQVKKIIIGYDHHFGRNRAANIDDLKAFGNMYDFEVEEISAQDINEVSVSSTKIRKALNSGDLKTANKYLGANYILSGKVVKGKGLGNTLGFPTANIHIKESYKLIPKHGVYIVKATIKTQTVFGMMNIGTNPTIDSNNQQSIEVHFFNFNEAIYNKNLVIELLDRIRDEKKFDSLDHLKNQLQKDRLTALQYIEKCHAQ